METSPRIGGLMSWAHGADGDTRSAVAQAIDRRRRADMPEPIAFPTPARPLLRRPVEDRLQRLRAVRVGWRRLAGLRDPAALRILPVAAVEEPAGLQAGPVDVVQAAGIDDDAVRLRTRDVEGVHAAMRAEGMLRDAGAEGVGLERALAPQQLEGGG